MRIPRAVLIVEFVVDGVAVGWDLLWVLVFCVVMCYSTSSSHSVYCHPSCVGQILTALVH
jgi:hypothetical protein